METLEEVLEPKCGYQVHLIPTSKDVGKLCRFSTNGLYWVGPFALQAVRPLTVLPFVGAECQWEFCQLAEDPTRTPACAEYLQGRPEAWRADGPLEELGWTIPDTSCECPHDDKAPGFQVVRATDGAFFLECYGVRGESLGILGLPVTTQAQLAKLVEALQGV